MNEIWILSIKTSLPGVCNCSDDLKEEFSAFDNFEKAKNALRAKLNELVSIPNVMFHQDGRIKLLSEYIEDMCEDDKEFNAKFEQITWAKILTKEVLSKLLSAISSSVMGKDLYLEIDEDKYTNFFELFLEVRTNSVYLCGTGDGPCNDIDPVIKTNIFSMNEEKDYYFHIIDKFGQEEASELHIDLRKLNVQ